MEFSIFSLPRAASPRQGGGQALRCAKPRRPPPARRPRSVPARSVAAPATSRPALSAGRAGSACWLLPSQQLPYRNYICTVPKHRPTRPAVRLRHRCDEIAGGLPVGEKRSLPAAAQCRPTGTCGPSPLSWRRHVPSGSTFGPISSFPFILSLLWNRHVKLIWRRPTEKLICRLPAEALSKTGCICGFLSQNSFSRCVHPCLFQLPAHTTVAGGQTGSRTVQRSAASTPTPNTQRTRRIATHEESCSRFGYRDS